MRQISNGLINQRLGLEPMLIVGIDLGSGEILFAEKTQTTRGASAYQGKLLDVSGIDDVMNFAGSGSAGSVSVKIDDTDGTFRKAMVKVDLHKKPVTIYQGFSGYDDKFMIYEGEINSPIVWTEGDRIITFTCVTIIEDLEVGFSAEAGQIPNLPDEAIGVPWPMCFGTPKHVPGLTFQKVPIGQIMTNIMIPDRTLQLSLQFMQAKLDLVTQFTDLDGLYMALAAWAGDWDAEQYYEKKLEQSQLDQQKFNQEAQQRMMDRINKMRQYDQDTQNTESQLVGPITQGYTYLANHGRYFPVGKTIICKAGDFLLKGVVDQDAKFTFEVLQPPIPRMQPWSDPIDPATGRPKDQGIGWIVPAWTESDMYVGPDNNIEPIYRGNPGYGPHNIMLQPGYRFQDSIEPEGIRFIPAGTSIQIVSDVDIEYILNIAPNNSVDRVWAYRYQNNVRSLCLVPEMYYRVVEHTYSHQEGGGSTGQPFKATCVVLKRPLSGYAFEGWEDQIFADLTCGVPGQIGDILEYLITQFTNRGIDKTSWNTGGTALDDCSFCFRERGNVLSVLAAMAYQTRHAIYLKNKKFCLQYLPVAPRAVATITANDIEAGSLEITCTPTEELITKIKATYQHDYAIDQTSLVTIKYNDLKYGLKLQEDTYYVYKHTESVMKSATFWVLRKGNTWTKLKFKTFLPFLILETFDGVYIDLGDTFPFKGQILGVVESCQYSASDNTVDLEVWLPVPFGSDSPSPAGFPGEAEAGMNWEPYVGVGVEVQSKPAFYANPVRALVPLVLGDNEVAQSQKTTPADSDFTEQKKVSLTDEGGAQSDDGDGTPWDPKVPDPVPPPKRIHVDRWNYDDIFKKDETPVEEIPLISCCPGKIIDFSNDAGTYTVEAYPYGLGGKSYKVPEVTVLQVAKDMWFPKDTWVLLNKIRDKKGKAHFYMQPPVWLP